MLPKGVVEHFEGFTFRPDNVTPKAYGNANNQYLRCLNRNRLFWKYRQERARAHEKVMGKTSFYKQYSSNISKGMKQETCCCTVCIEKMAGSCNMLRELVSLVFGGTVKGREYSDAVEDVEYFHARYYRGMLCVSSTDVHLCMTFALSNAKDADLRSQCGHSHSLQSEVTQQADHLFSSLEKDIQGLQK